MKTLTIEQLAEVRYNASRSANPDAIAATDPWEETSQFVKDCNITGMRAAITAYLDSVGEGMPSVEDVESLLESSRNVHVRDDAIAVRNLMLAAFAKQLSLKDSKIADLEHLLKEESKRELQSLLSTHNSDALAKLATIAKLPEKWRNNCAAFKTVYAAELEAALGATPAAEPAPNPNTPTQFEALAAIKLVACEHPDGVGALNHITRICIDAGIKMQLDELKQMPRVAAIGNWRKTLEQRREDLGKIAAEPAPDQCSCTNPVTPEPDCEKHGEAPAPAGKLSDEELGEIGAEAVVEWWKAKSGEPMVARHAQAAFARAVAEAVRKERAICIPDAKQAEKIGQLTDQLTTLRAENAKQAEEIERLSWRPVSVKPKLEDSDAAGYVIMLINDGKLRFNHWNDWRLLPTGATHWRPASPPPAPTKEEANRAEFEVVYREESLKLQPQGAVFDNGVLARGIDDEYVHWAVKGAFVMWNRGRASKEGQPLTKQEERA